MAPSHIVVSLLSAMVAAVAPNENVKMIHRAVTMTPNAEAFASSETVKMIRRAVTVQPNGEIASAVEVDKQLDDSEPASGVEVEKQLVDITQVEENEGVHSDAFTAAHDSIVDQLELKQKDLQDWLAENCITTKTKEKNDKAHELAAYQGAFADKWWQKAFSWIKRKWMNLFYKKETRLKAELATLQDQVTSMTAERKRLQKEVDDRKQAKALKVTDANKLLKELAAEVSALTTDIETHRNAKAAAKKLHRVEKDKKIEEHKAEEAVHTETIDNARKQLAPKRVELYDLTATCAQYAKKETTICKKCSPPERACGGSCRSVKDQKTCDADPGCACNDVVGHTLHDEFNKAKKALETTKKEHENTIKASIDFLASNALEDAKVRKDKAESVKNFDGILKRLLDDKTAQQDVKTNAEKELEKTKNAIAAATEANEAAVTKLETELKAAFTGSKAILHKEQKSKTATLARQEALMKEFMETHDIVLADWDAKILNAKTEKARVEKEHTDLAAAIANVAT